MYYYKERNGATANTEPKTKYYFYEKIIILSLRNHR